MEDKILKELDNVPYNGEKTFLELKSKVLNLAKSYNLNNKEWEHFLIPNKPMWFRDIMRNFMALNHHCLKCTALDGCYFLKVKSQIYHYI